MLNKIIDLSLKNRVLVLLCTLLLLSLGLHSLWKTSVDALPDLSDPQVIVWTQAEGQSPQFIEEQITYPLSRALESTPGAKTVRSFSFFGSSMIYVIFEEGTDPYFARARVNELLNSGNLKLPPGIQPNLGPDASGLGWVYQYTLSSSQRSLADLRSIQDWTLRPALSALPGVAEIASLGGYVKQVQVRINPQVLSLYRLSMNDLYTALQNANSAVGGEVLETGEAEFMIRSQNYLRDLEQIRQIPLKSADGRALLLGDLASVDWGPAPRRGAAELNGQGEVVSGIVVMRQGENARQIIAQARAKLEDIQKQLPADVKIEMAYDRSQLIDRAIQNLSHKLWQEMAVVALVCALFLMHLRSALIAVITLPLALLFSISMMQAQGLSANIMSLGGLAIAIGAMVDAAIIMVENAHKHLSRNQLLAPESQVGHWQVVRQACQEVGPALFWSLSLITISFGPIFALSGQEGRLFTPLAWTKTYAMAGATMLSLTLIPVLIGYVLKGPLPKEERNPLNQILISMYRRALNLTWRWPKTSLGTAIILLLSSIYPMTHIGSEFMPALDEGDLLYMPTTAPGISITKAKELLRRTDTLILEIPEVQAVLGKVGRAETATDPAGLDMLETVIRLKPKDQWRPGVNVDSIIAELDRKVQIPGLTNAWTRPIKARIDMLSTGIKTPLGLKISGAHLDTLTQIAQQAQNLLKSLPSTASAFAEQSSQGNYIDIQINRNALVQYGLDPSEIQSTVSAALGGIQSGIWIQGLERYSIQIRLHRDSRDQLDDLRHIPIPKGSQTIALGELAQIQFSQGPMFIRSEDGRPHAWVFIDTRESDLGSYIQEAQALLRERLTMPMGYQLEWSGEYESMQRARATLTWVIPMTLLLILIILYLNTQSLAKTFLILAAVPFSLIGAFWGLYLADYQWSVAVAVGMIALAGLDAETGSIMLLYLDQALKKAREQHELTTPLALMRALDQGAVQRIRPKIMTATVILAGLLPIMWSDGTGSDVMKRIALPMVGGIVSSVLMELWIYPLIYWLWFRSRLQKPRAP